MTLTHTELFLFAPTQADQSGTIVEVVAQDGKAVAIESVSLERFLVLNAYAANGVGELLEEWSCSLFQVYLLVLLQPLFIIQP